MKIFSMLGLCSMTYLCLFGCVNSLNKKVSGKWELQNVFLKDVQKWGKMSDCNKFEVFMAVNGQLNVENNKCGNELPSDVVSKFEWKLNKDTLIFEVLGKGKLINVNDSIMIIDFFDKKIRQGIYYFKRTNW